MRITLRELTAIPEQLRREHPEQWTRLPSPSYPGPRILHDGDTIVVPLLINPETGQRIVDYLSIYLVPYPESTNAPDSARPQSEE